MLKVLFAGSFDPPTFGHLDLIKRATTLFDKVIVAIAYNPNKKHFLSPQDRLQYFQKIPEIEVHIVEGLICEFAKKNGIHLLLRGIRSSASLQHELELAYGNKKLANLETIFLPTDPKYSFISSSLVREIAQNGGNLKDFVPEEILALCLKAKNRLFE